MAFDVAADAYGRFMGRYSEPLGPVFAEWAGVHRGDRVLDVGCGPGALTAELVTRLGVTHVAAVDPSAPFVESVRARLPGLEVHRAPAEQLPFDDGGFDRTLAQLVVHFMQDPVTGLGEMARVTRRGGVVAACTWDLGGHRSPLDPLWEAVRRIDPLAADESHLARGARGPPRRARHRGRAARRRERRAHGRRDAPRLRRVVGALHARRRARG